jgi:hypothetical protein
MNSAGRGVLHYFFIYVSPSVKYDIRDKQCLSSQNNTTAQVFRQGGDDRGEFFTKSLHRSNFVIFTLCINFS